MRYERNIDIRAVGRLVAATPGWRRKLERAVSLSAHEISRCPRSVFPYVSVSGGKDSVAVLAVVAEGALLCDRKVIAWAHVSDASFPGTEDTIREACRTAGVDLHIDRSPVSAYEVYGHAGDKKFGKEGFFFAAIRSWVESGHALCFTGVRAAESKRRYEAACAHGTAFDTRVPAPHRKCEPLAWWTIEDVAAAIHHFGMPLHPIYRKRCLTPVPIRLGYITAADWAADMAPFLRVNYPEQFARLAQVAPEVRNHV